eukprot:1001162_1
MLYKIFLFALLFIVCIPSISAVEDETVNPVDVVDDTPDVDDIADIATELDDLTKDEDENIIDDLDKDDDLYKDDDDFQVTGIATTDDYNTVTDSGDEPGEDIETTTSNTIDDDDPDDLPSESQECCEKSSS